MVSMYTLSYSGYTYVDEDKTMIFKWVRVQPHQIKKGMDAFPTLPELKQGQLVKYSIVDRGIIILKVLGNGELRELSKRELEAPNISIRI